MPTAELIPPAHGGLLARLDILINLVADRRGLALDLSGRLAAAEARLVAEALELIPAAEPDPGDPGDPGGAGGAVSGPGASPSPRDLAAVELLRALGQAIGLLRDRGDRIEATTLRHPWRQLDPGLRAGLVYAAWCHRVPWTEMLDGAPALTVLREGRTRVLRLLFGLPAGVEVDLDGLVDAVADRLHLPAGEWLLRAVAAVFLDPLVALGVAEIDPPSPQVPASARLGGRAETVIGSALIAAGEDLPLSRAG